MVRSNYSEEELKVMFRDSKARWKKEYDQRVRDVIDFVRINECDKHNEYIIEALIKELGL